MDNICPKAGECGSCTYMGKTYEESLSAKEESVKKLMKGIVGEVLPIRGAADPFYYRNKVHSAFGRDKKGNIISGTYMEGSHRIVMCDGCLIEDRTAAAIIRDIRDLIRSFKLQVYNEKTGTGLIRRVLIRVGRNSGQVLVTIIVADHMFPGKKNLVRELVKKHPEITTVVININRRSDSMILGERSETVYGKGFITDDLLGMSFRISPESFYQINTAQTEVLYSEALKMADIGKNDTVLDAYCGTGTIGLIASGKAGRVTGVESNPRAVRDAIENAKHNKAGNIRFVKGDATEFMVREAQEGRRYDVIIMDPPRSGTTKEFIEGCRKVSPDRIVYVSCDPKTQARDLKIFKENGYRAETLLPVDMFPWTDSVEVVSLLQKMSNTRERTITLDVEMEDYHRIKNRTEVTADATE